MPPVMSLPPTDGDSPSPVGRWTTPPSATGRQMRKPMNVLIPPSLQIQPVGPAVTTPQPRCDLDQLFCRLGDDRHHTARFSSRRLLARRIGPPNALILRKTPILKIKMGSFLKINFGWSGRRGRGLFRDNR
jgi:hypothetical protein